VCFLSELTVQAHDKKERRTRKRRKKKKKGCQKEKQVLFFVFCCLYFFVRFFAKRWRLLPENSRKNHSALSTNPLQERRKRKQKKPEDAEQQSCNGLTSNKKFPVCGCSLFVRRTKSSRVNFSFCHFFRLLFVVFLLQKNFIKITAAGTEEEGREKEATSV